MRAPRWAFIIVLLTLTQVALVPQLRINGIAPDLFLVLAAVAASRNGPETGAVIGFFGGLAFDLFLTSPFGAAALAGAIAGFVLGSSHVFFGVARWWATPGLAFLSGMIGGSVLLLIQILAGNDGLGSARSIIGVVVAALFDAVTALWVFPLARLVMGTHHFGRHRLRPHG